MSKIMLVTDTHLGIKKSNDLYLEVVYNLFVDICSHAKENNIKELIHLGDFFDNRKHLSLKALSYAEKIGLLINNTFDNAYFILGNHDLYYKDRYYPTSHQIFTEYDNIHLVDEPHIVNDILLVPWQLEKVETINFNDYDTPFCMGHFDIIGAKMGINNISTDGKFTIQSFTQFKKVISGHYHTRGQYNNIEYIGAPYHQTFNDAGVRGYYVFDNGDLEFIEYDKYPQYISMIAREDVITKHDIEGKVIKLVFQVDFGTLKNNEIIKSIQDCNPLQLFIKYQFDRGMTDEKQEEDVNLKSVEDIHIDFVDRSETPSILNRDVLKKMINQLYNELKGEK